MPYGKYAGKLKGITMAMEQGSQLRQEEENKRRYEAEKQRQKEMDEENQKRFEEAKKQADEDRKIKLEMLKEEEDRRKKEFASKEEDVAWKKEVREKYEKPTLEREILEGKNRERLQEQQYNEMMKPAEDEGLVDFIDVLSKTSDPEQAKQAFNAKGKFKMLEVRKEADGNTWVLEDRNGEQKWRTITPQMIGLIKQHISQGRKYVPYSTPVEYGVPTTKRKGTRSIEAPAVEGVAAEPSQKITSISKPSTEQLKQEQQIDVGIIAGAAKNLGYNPTLFVEEVTIGKDPSGQIITRQQMKTTDQLTPEALAILAKFNNLRSLEASKNIPPSEKKTEDQLALEAVNTQLKADKNYSKIEGYQKKINDIDAKIAKISEGEPIPENLLQSKKQFQDMIDNARTNMLGGAKSAIPSIKKKSVTEIPGVTKVK